MQIRPLHNRNGLFYLGNKKNAIALRITAILCHKQAHEYLR